MIVLLIMSAVIGSVVSACTGIGILFWIAGGAVLIFGLPFALISSFIHGEVSYVQDRADYRQAMTEIKAEELTDEHEFAEDARVDRLAAAIKRKKKPSVTVDNRQVHIHGRVI
jgi:hypothetical protein